MGCRFFFIITAIGIAGCLCAQSPVQIADSIPENLDISANTGYYRDLKHIAGSFDDMKDKEFLPLQSLDQLSNRPSDLSSVIIWLKISFNNAGASQSLLLDIGKQRDIQLYTATGELLQQTGSYYFPYNNDQWKPLNITPDSGKISTYFIRVLNNIRKGDIIRPVLHSPKSLANHFYRLENSVKQEMIFMFFATGCLFIMSLFSLAQYWFRKKNLFLFYFLFCFTGCLLSLWDVNYQFNAGLPLHMRTSSQVFAYLITIFYTLFIRKIIRLDAQFPFAWKVLKVLMVILLVQLSISLYEYFNPLVFNSNFYYLNKAKSILAADIILFICILFCKSPVKYFLLAGASFLWIPNFILESSILNKISNAGIKNFWIYSLASIAVLFENFAFLLALAYMNYKIEKEKKEMQENYSKNLENEIKEKTREMEVKQQLLQDVKIRNIESTLKQQIVETEIAALKAQMKPHFIFNCINSIDSFIQSNDKYNATMYLNKFARLIRNVLDSSMQNVVFFSKDVESLKLYIELEELRHEGKFSTKYDIDAELMNSDYKVPPLIVQPFVENAILHGLRNRPDDKGKLFISIQKKDEQIRYIIEDNGTGRNGNIITQKKEKKSYGMQISSDRIKLFNKTEEAALKITDLTENGEASGTRVEVTLNIQ